MKKFMELKLEERKEIAELFANWLEMYTDEIIIKVMAKADEIINNEMAVYMLRELKARDEEESTELKRTISWMLEGYDKSDNGRVRFASLTHASSYRDVLYDMYIR